MSEKLEEQPSLSAEDAEFIGRLAEHYVPPPLSAARSTELDAELHGRIVTPRGLAFERPAFATAAVLLAIGLALALGAFESTAPEGARPDVVFVGSPSAADWERGLFDPDALDDFDAGDDLGGLPDDYAAIAGIFLDG
ncbi:MAG: hypothetical protein JRG80_02115 [Deltaproteobacteria bacterium]|nr:hypothetical protein [Deltaproteobacteria bacterium]